VDAVQLAKDYLAANAAESGADEVIRLLIAEVEALRSGGLTDWWCDRMSAAYERGEL
jgi:hypothetical protein